MQGQLEKIQKGCAGAYRYGFNGKEKDNPGMGGGGNTYDYGFRIYNPEIGKFLSVDPLAGSYPSWSPYPFAMNRPIDGIDLDGLEYFSNVFLIEQQGRSHIRKGGDKQLLKEFDAAMRRINNVQFAATVIPNAVIIDLYMATGKISREIINQFKIQVIANSAIESISYIGDENKGINQSLESVLNKSLSGVDGADAIISVFVKNKEAVNVLSSLVDLSYNSETGELEFNSLIKGKSVSDVVIDAAFNFGTESLGEKISKTKFSGPVKDALNAAGVDINTFSKDILKGRDRNEEVNFDPAKIHLKNSNTFENDATRVAPNSKIID